MNMQDKDLDQLFRSKLDGFEAEPSAGVWANISNELNEPKKNKGGMFWLSVAASVLVFISAGLYFMPKDQIEITKPKNQLAENHLDKKPAVVSPVTTTPQVTMAQTQPISGTKSQQALATVVHYTVNQPSGTTQTIPIITPDPVETTPKINDQQQVVAATGNTTINKPVVPDATTPLINKINDVQPVTKPTAILASITEKDTTPAPAKKHKIHGLGSFINAVVAVVDKRDDKFIEFTDTNEGNMVTGVNLGIVTIKKNQ